MFALMCCLWEVLRFSRTQAWKDEWKKVEHLTKRLNAIPITDWYWEEYEILKAPISPSGDILRISRCVVDLGDYGVVRYSLYINNQKITFPYRYARNYFEYELEVIYFHKDQMDEQAKKEKRDDNINRVVS